MLSTYGIAALVAEGIAAKLGFFKGLWVALFAAKKFIIIGIIALVVARNSSGRARTSPKVDASL